MLRLIVALSLVALAQSCELSPQVRGALSAKAPGDNFYKLVINGDVERYRPGERYVVTLVGSRTHNVVQQFTRFKLTLDPLNPLDPRSRKQGEFQLFADTLSKFDELCSNSVVEADDLPKTEVQVMWKAPPAGSGCVLLKAMVFESESRWFAEDGQLTRRVCEDTTVNNECCACDDATYKMVFEGIWSPQTHPKDFPTQALWLTHFSDVIGATHPTNFSFWGEGQIATDGFRSLAEWGSVQLLERELRSRGSQVRSLVKAPGLWHPKVNTNTTATFTVDRKRHLLSLASMFGPSPDWVVGVSGLELCQTDCSWSDTKVVDLFPYDAGTDNGISYMSPNSETRPREKMSRITPMYPEDPRAPFYNPGAKEVPPLARIYLYREKITPRNCDEEVLLSQVVEDVETSESVNRPECAVTPWSGWSACSVPCGKGLRMRSRQYLLPDKAAMLGCGRVMVNKEMCVAAVAECESDAPPEVPLPSSDTSLPDMCAVSAWGPWEPCSVSCGEGVTVRRRHFLNHMGYKKCPLVSVEETKQCTERECTSEDVTLNTINPECPTTEWSPWSPCPPCGVGTQFQSRLLLVAADKQRYCANRTVLLQQRPCVGDPCQIDMQTAKRICMEPPDQGPCRGEFQRWAFVAMKGMCIPFPYGGCRGNKNNFLTQQECLDTCGLLLGGGPVGAPNDVSGNSVLPSNNTQEVSGVQNCVMSAWSEWSRCSVTCGVGYQQRTRTILTQPGPGGAPCPAKVLRRRRCSRPC